MLRHQPERIGLELDAAGWANVDELLAKLPLERDVLIEIVASSDKRRFELSEDGSRIRARQGHSVDVELGWAPAEPPELLFHGTVERFVAAIREQGLVRGARHHVHLSPDRETAERVGNRRGKPVVLVVRARAMAAAGHVFLKTDNDVWLTEHVPPEFLAE